MKKTVLLFALCALIFAGCNKEPKDTPEQDCQVVVSFSTTDNASSLLKASTEEEAISKIKLFGVDAAGNVTAYPVKTGTFTAGSTVTQTILRTVKTLYAIANPSAAMETATPANLTDLMALTGSYTTAPQSPFLMSGSVQLTSYTAPMNVTIQLVRTVAKVGITSTNLTITSVTVKNTPNFGFVFPQSPMPVPAAATLIAYTAVSVTPPATVPMLYVAENSSSTPTVFEIVGTYNSKTVTYPITLKVSGSAIDIVRNTYYKVNVEPITESTCNITLSIPDWNDVNTDEHVIPD